MRRWLLVLLFLYPAFGMALIPPQEHVAAPTGQISQRITMNMKKVVPMNLTEGLDQKTVQTRIFDHSLSTFVTDQVKRQKGGIWSAARNLKDFQDKMKIKTTSTPDPSIYVHPEDIVVHEFSFQMQAFQRTANFNYKGSFTANLRYEFAQKTMNFEVKLDF